MVSVKNCKTAILNASKGKHRRRAVEIILKDIDRYAAELSERMQALNFITPYRTRIICDGLSGKTREIQVPAFFPDQCAHHAIVQIIGPIISSSMYYWSCANTPRKGIDLACIGVERATIRHEVKYCIKGDIKKFYPSVPHDLLKARFRQKIKDEKALAILDKVVDSHDKGLPIGNYTSPWFAEFYLQPLDHFVKQELKAKYYVRYADDIVIIGTNKRKMHKMLKALIIKIEDMGLEMKHNYQLFKIYDGKSGRKIDFVGKCFSLGYTTVRKRRALALMRQSRKIQKAQAKKAPISYRMASGFISRCACFKHTRSKGLKKKYYDTVDIENLKEVIRKHGVAHSGKLGN